MVHALSDPTVRLFSICSAILTINMLFKATLIGVLRNMRGVHISPEDYRLLGRPVRPPDELIERTRRAHQNDVENILPFFGIGLLFALSGVSPTVAWWLIVVFTASRLLHTVFYLAARQPWRSLIFTVGALDLGAMAVLLLWRA
jgi:uncharacterized MAPEG superfamily protein